MTLRLIAVMGVVLLLCLGAFGLLANHYHKQVMDEAAHIASESAKAIFGSFDRAEDGNFFLSDNLPGQTTLAWSSRTPPQSAATPTRIQTQAQLMIVGDVDHCLLKVERYAEAGLDHFISLMQSDRIPHEKVKRSIELFATKIAPRFQ